MARFAHVLKDLSRFCRTVAFSSGRASVCHRFLTPDLWMLPHHSPCATASAMQAPPLLHRMPTASRLWAWEPASAPPRANVARALASECSQHVRMREARRGRTLPSPLRSLPYPVQTCSTVVFPVALLRGPFLGALHTLLSPVFEPFFVTPSPLASGRSSISIRAIRSGTLRRGIQIPSTDGAEDAEIQQRQQPLCGLHARSF